MDQSNAHDIDKQIIAQQEEIQANIAATKPLISSVLEFSELESDYTDNDDFMRKIPHLKANYTSFRRVRPDGNCFYRAYVYTVLEQIILHKHELDQAPYSGVYANIKSFLDSADALLSGVGFDRFCYEDYLEVIAEVVNGVADYTVEKLEALFLDQGESDCLVMFARFIVSAWLRTRAEEYAPFVDGYPTLMDFVKAEVDPMNREADQLMVMALTGAFGVRAVIEYLDRTEGNATSQFVFPMDYNGPDFSVHMLYRPGHYDVLYKS